MVNRAPRRQVVGQQFPGTAASDGITDAVDNLASRVLGRTTARHSGRDEKFEVLPLGIGDVAVVRLAKFHLDRVPNLFKLPLSSALETYMARRAKEYSTKPDA